MTTAEVAKGIIDLYNQGKAVEAEQMYYADDVVSYEQDPSMAPTKGKDAVIAKTQAAFGGVKDFVKSEATAVFVNNDSFLVIFDNDFTMANGFQVKGLEYGFYKVSEGKVVEEYFYMMPVA